MTITTPFHQDVRKDGQVDRRVDVQTDGRKAAVKTGRAAFVIVLANHKGGVTKTTSTANLGAMLAEAGRRVLIVDCDPQANLTEAFGWAAELPGERLEDLLAHPDAAGRYAPPLALQPDVAPGLPGASGCGSSRDRRARRRRGGPPRDGRPGYELRLREVLEPLREQFDLVLLDTPPGLGTLSGMAVLAADGLLIPALAADLDVRGAGKLYDLVEGEIPGLRILGVLLAASERRWRVTRDATDRMTRRRDAGAARAVPRAVRVASAPRHRAPTVVLEPDSMVSHAYRQLAHHLLGSSGDERTRSRCRPSDGGRSPGWPANRSLPRRRARPSRRSRLTPRTPADVRDRRRRGREPATARIEARSSRAAPTGPAGALLGSRPSGGRRPITRARGWSTSGSRWTCTTASAAWSARPSYAIRGCGGRA